MNYTDNIFIRRDDKEAGPFTLEQVRDQMAQGLIDASMLASFEGGNWRPLVELLVNPHGSLKTRDRIKRVSQKIEKVGRAFLHRS